MKYAFAIIVAILFVSVELLSVTNVGQYWDLIERFENPVLIDTMRW